MISAFKDQIGSEAVRIFTKGSKIPGDVMERKLAQPIVENNNLRQVVSGIPRLERMKQLILPADTKVEEAAAMFDRMG